MPELLIYKLEPKPLHRSKNIARANYADGDDAILINRLIAWLIYKEKISTTPSLDGGVGTPQRGDKRRGA